MRPAAVVELALLVGLAGCPGRTSTGTLELRWKGTERGVVTGSATGQWCDLLRLLEIRVVKGDTGVAVAIYPRNTLVAGTYPIRAPLKAESLPPAAAVALRWAGPTAVKGFQGESGNIVLERSSGGAVSGRLTAAARSATDTGFLELTGQFRDLAVQSSKLGCVAGDTLDAPRTDTLVH
ncbi:MAG TPA: hypothetical protein VFH40_06130 [Gemmatimonadales bacterium]|nr:hypothetical protein [Gemmatimonadales bacterium]